MLQTALPPAPAHASNAVLFLDALITNWPIVAAAISVTWYLARMSRSVETLNATVAAIAKRQDKRLDAHSDRLDDHDRRITANAKDIEHLQRRPV